MLTQILPAASALLGALVGGGVTFISTALKSKTDREIAARQMEHQLEIAQQQLRVQLEVVRQEHATQLEVEREKQRREKTEAACAQLMIWLYGLELTINEVWFGVCSDDADLVGKVQGLLDRWPWETLRPPKEAAATQHYWSEQVRELLSKFNYESASFTSAASVAIKGVDWYPGDKEKAKEGRSKAQSDAWESRRRLIGIIEKIRESVHNELLA